MASLVSALDTITNIQYGENNHIEYKWSTIQQEKILQISFQIVRTKDSNKKEELTNKFMECFINGSNEDKIILLKLLAHTRDIENGKGEYALTYAILKKIYIYDKKLAITLLILFVDYEEPVTTESKEHKQDVKPIGCWKDIKYFCNEIKDISTELSIKLPIELPIELLDMYNGQIRMDDENMKSTKNCSLAAKWIPREKSSKFGWINEELAKNYFQEYGKSMNGWSKSAINKAKTHYRKLISSLNKYIETTQINQCGKNWSQINFNKVTSITLMKQKKAFLNDKENPEEDRRNCKENLLNHIQKVKEGKYEIKGKNTSMVNFIKEALTVNSEEERFIINEAWKNNGKSIKSLDNMIAMVDTSGSMECENNNPLYSAMGLGIRISEKSKLGKRIMTFNNNPQWINLDGCKDFVEEVNTVREAGWGMNTNFHKAMDMILDVIIKNKVPAEEVENLVLTVLSDMQFDQAEKTGVVSTYNECVRQILQEKFHQAGIKICGKGYKLPHILFWNLRSSDGFPEVSYQENVTMLSGYSPMLLNSFVEVGMKSLKEITPWNMLVKMLDNKRYDKIGKLIQ